MYITILFLKYSIVDLIMKSHVSQIPLLSSHIATVFGNEYDGEYSSITLMIGVTAFCTSITFFPLSRNTTFFVFLILPENIREPATIMSHVQGE